MKVVKKLLKISALYLLFGLIIAVVFTVCGGYREYVINRTLGAMTTFEYIWVVGMVSLGWLPTAIFELQSSVKVFRFPYATPIIAAVVILFFIFCLRIILKKHR